MCFVFIVSNQGTNKQNDKKKPANTREIFLLEKLIFSLNLILPEFSTIYLQQRESDPNSESLKPRPILLISISTEEHKFKLTRSQTVLLHFTK